MNSNARATRIALQSRQLLMMSTAMVALASCGGGSSTAQNGVGGASAGATGSPCPDGSETCACYGNKSCDDGLVCASNLCVSLGGSGGGHGKGGSSADVSSGGVVAAGGTTNLVGNGGTSLTGGSGGSGGSAGATTVPQKCGNGFVEGTETCDPFTVDNNLGDGCTPSCMAEPACPAAGGPCTSSCGDGLVFDNEACDDGNAKDGDGCSSTCTVETGFVCAQPVLGDTMVVPMVVRDFNAGGDFEKGAAFALGLNYPNQKLLKSTLDANGVKPVLTSTTGTYNGKSGEPSGIASAASFAMWFDETAPVVGNTRNGTLATTLNLYLNDDKSAYVNRFGVGGNGLTSAKYQKTVVQQCINEAKVAHNPDGTVMPCYACYIDSNPATPECDGGAQACMIGGVEPTECHLVNGYYVGTVIESSFDGNPLFFPADALTPFSPSGLGQISGNYNNAWPVVPEIQHNFSFTTEVRSWFKYDAAKGLKLSMVGDDDIWIFVNKRLAIDLAGIHTAVAGELSIASGTGLATVSVTPKNVDPATTTTSTVDLGGLVNGSVYEIAVFHAERQVTVSSYRLNLPGFNTSRSVCRSQ